MAEGYSSISVPDTREGWKAQAEYLGTEYNKLADRWSACQEQLARVRVVIGEMKHDGDDYVLNYAERLDRALSSEATKGEQAPPPPVRPPGVGITETGGRSK